MDFLLNDLSLHEQFIALNSFSDAINAIMQMRRSAQQFGLNLYCSRGFINRKVAPGIGLQKAINGLDRNQQRAVMGWITLNGPFWETVRKHSEDEYLTCDLCQSGEVVTDSALGEAAHCCLLGIPRHLVSITPSNWNSTPVVVKRDETELVEIENYWDITAFQKALNEAPPPVSSWGDLKQISIQRFTNLTFTEDCFEPLRGLSWRPSSAMQLLTRFERLNKLKSCFDADGKLTPEGKDIFDTHFTGETAWFSLSSPGELREYEKELTFDHPASPGNKLLCSWHGKVNGDFPIRFHFSDILDARSPVYVVYIGKKITTR